MLFVSCGGPEVIVDCTDRRERREALHGKESFADCLANMIQAPKANVWLQVSEKQTTANKDNLELVDPVWGSTGSRKFNEWAVCGGHVAETCAGCPMQVIPPRNWCNGDCSWDESVSSCVRTTDWTGAVENSQMTSLVPCCGGPGHPAYMAVDGSDTTYWLADAAEAASSLVVEILDGTSTVAEVEITWTEDYAVKYSIELSRDGLDFVGLAEVVDGDGEVDQVRLEEAQEDQPCDSPFKTSSVSTFAPCPSNQYSRDCSASCSALNGCSGHGRCDGLAGLCTCDRGWTGASCQVKMETKWRFIRLVLKTPTLGSTRYGVREVKVYGDSRISPVSCQPVGPANVTAAGMITAKTSLTPRISSVEPARGTTAGGSDVTITGDFFLADASLLNVTIGEFPCEVQSVETIAGGEVQIKCVSGASGVLHGGKKYVIVTAEGHGSSAPVDSAVFWYIDTWSARYAA